MPKHYKEMIDEIINKMDEDAPANNASGNVDMAPNAAVSHSPQMMKRKKKQGDEQEKIKKKIGNLIKTNEDSNNVILNQINIALDKAETKLDEKVYGKTEIKVEPQYKTFRDKYNA